MCKQCQTNPVYEFTNKRKVCKTCFIRWFQKKFLYTIRKFGMIDREDKIGFKNKRGFRDAVLNDLLRLYSEKGSVEIVKIRSTSSHLLIASNRRSARFSTKELLSNKNYADDKLISKDIISSSNNYRAKRDYFPTKIAVSSTADTEADEIIHILIKGNADKLKHGPVEKIESRIVIKPLYLFLDKEVLLYAKLRKLKFKIKNEKKDKISLFVNDLEKKHPEVKQSVISSYLELFG